MTNANRICISLKPTWFSFQDFLSQVWLAGMVRSVHLSSNGIIPLWLEFLMSLGRLCVPTSNWLGCGGDVILFVFHFMFLFLLDIIASCNIFFYFFFIYLFSLLLARVYKYSGSQAYFEILCIPLLNLCNRSFSMFKWLSQR